MGLTVLADPILCLLYKPESAHLASPLLTLLAPSSFFVCILAVTNSILHSCGEERKTVMSMLAGAVIKCVSSRILLETIGISGAPVSTLLCYLTVTALNFVFVVRAAGISVDFIRVFLRPMLASSVCALTAVLVYSVIGGKIGCIAAILSAAAVYFVSLIVIRVVEPEEIKAVIHRKDVQNIERKNFQTEK